MDQNIKSVNIVNGYLIIKGSILSGGVKKNKDKVKIIIYNREEKFYFEESLNINEGKFIFHKSIDTIIKNIKQGKEINLDIYIEYDGKKVLLDISNVDYIDEEYKIKANIYSIKLLKESKTKVSLNLHKSNTEIVEVKVEDVEFYNGNINLDISIQSENIINKKLNKILILKNRNTKLEYKFTIYKEVYNKYKFLINLNDIMKINSGGEEGIWDIYFKLDDEYIPVKADKNYKFDYYESMNKNYFKFKPYRTGFNTLSIYIKTCRVDAIISNISLEDSILRFDGNIESNDIDIWKFIDNKSTLILKRREEVDGRYSDILKEGKNPYLDEIELKIEYLNTYFDFSSSFILDILDKNQYGIWDLFLQLSDEQNRKYDIKLEMLNSKYDIYKNINNNKIRLFMNKFNHGLSCHICEKE